MFLCWAYFTALVGKGSDLWNRLGNITFEVWLSVSSLQLHHTSDDIRYNSTTLYCFYTKVLQTQWAVVRKRDDDLFLFQTWCSLQVFLPLLYDIIRSYGPLMMSPSYRKPWGFSKNVMAYPLFIAFAHILGSIFNRHLRSEWINKDSSTAGPDRKLVTWEPTIRWVPTKTWCNGAALPVHSQRHRCWRSTGFGASKWLEHLQGWATQIPCAVLSNQNAWTVV